MSDLIPKPGIKIGGLSRAAQKLQAAREKAERGSKTAKPLTSTNNNTVKANSVGARKTSFQRKAV